MKIACIGALGLLKHVVGNEAKGVASGRRVNSYRRGGCFDAVFLTACRLLLAPRQSHWKQESSAQLPGCSHLVELHG